MNPWLAAGIVAVTLVVTSPFLSEGRHYDARPLFSNSLGDSSEDSSANLFNPSEFPLARNMRPFRMKRMLFDSNCRGIYDQKMMGKLDDVCDSCYNLYRKPYIATECRKYCYNNGVFESCLNDLLMHDVADEYRSMVQYLGKK